MDCKSIDNGGAIGADPVSLRTTQGFCRNFGKGYKTQARNQINNLMTDNCKWHRLVDRKIFLVFILGNIFTNDWTKSKSILIKTVHV